MLRWVVIVCLGVACGWLADAPHAAAQTQSKTTPVVVQAQLKDEAITPVTARYLERAARRANRADAACLLIRLDTPGGLLSATRRIVKNILDADVPVVVYVAPPGGRAASAGLFITLSGHVAAMAPATNIGAAHPVQMGGGGGPMPGGGNENKKEKAPRTAPATQPRSTKMEKALNDTKAWVRALAERRGRNADWAVRAVTESATLTATKAADKNVIDLVAKDNVALLEALDGRSVELATGRSTTLRTANARIEAVDMWWGERTLAVLANPNLAFLLMMLGFYGILFEFYTPGWGVGGTVGVVALVLAMFGLSVLPVNYAGLALMVVGLALLAAEVFVTSFGALTLGGAICVALGGLMLVDSPSDAMRVSLSLILPIVIATAAITLLLVGGIARAHAQGVRVGNEAMIGRQALVRGPFSRRGKRYQGYVSVHGELWRAVSDTPVREGGDVTVQAQSGLTLEVAPRTEADQASPASGSEQGKKEGGS